MFGNQKFTNGVYQWKIKVEVRKEYNCICCGIISKEKLDMLNNLKWEYDSATTNELVYGLQMVVFTAKVLFVIERNQLLLGFMSSN